jgi:hypothetical protein
MLLVENKNNSYCIEKIKNKMKNKVMLLVVRLNINNKTVFKKYWKISTALTE